MSSLKYSFVFRTVMIAVNGFGGISALIMGMSISIRSKHSHLKMTQPKPSPWSFPAWVNMPPSTWGIP